MINNFLVQKYLSLLNASRRKIAITSLVLAVLLGALFYFTYALGSVSNSLASPKDFEVKSGDGFRDIVKNLKSEELIKSVAAFKLLSIVTGSAFKLKPGSYKLSPSMTSYKILGELILGSHREIVIMIPEGINVYEINKVLSQNGITKNRDIIKIVSEKKLEGSLFPDTYKFFTGSDAEEIIDKFLTNFKLRTENLGGGNIKSDILIMASILEKEVPDPMEQKVVAGILNKRLTLGIPLQVDATICYIKGVLDPNHDMSCNQLSTLDFKIDSPYNTYLHMGLPPGPIGNPGLLAIESAMNPIDSPYLFYLSDPETRKTIFSRTHEEHVKNKARYLRR